jgi:hypothetical protein
MLRVISREREFDQWTVAYFFIDIMWNLPLRPKNHKFMCSSVKAEHFYWFEQTLELVFIGRGFCCRLCTTIWVDHCEVWRFGILIALKYCACVCVCYSAKTCNQRRTTLHDLYSFYFCPRPKSQLFVIYDEKCALYTISFSIKVCEKIGKAEAVSSFADGPLVVR